MQNESPPIPVQSDVEPMRARRKSFNWNLVILPLVLIIGFAAGFLVRPIILPPKQAASTGSPLADMVVAQARHFRGNANAPVTLLEFSDFQ
jgi:hypothetical protein